VAGAAVGLRETMKLLSSQASTPAWPELAQFDCAACHHELRRPAWRQTQPGVPGRPALLQGPVVLAKLAATACGKDVAEFESLLEELRRAGDVQPFGTSGGVVEVADRLASWADDMCGDLNSLKIDRPLAKQLLTHLCEMGAAEMQHYDSARQIGWAISSLHAELTGPTSGEADEQGALPAGDEIAAILTDLDQTLRLSLPARLPASDTLPAEAAPGAQCSAAEMHGAIIDSLPTAFEFSAGYDPLWFQQQMQLLGTLLNRAAAE
jgi:hypothetical protein